MPEVRERLLELAHVGAVGRGRAEVPPRRARAGQADDRPGVDRVERSARSATVDPTGASQVTVPGTARRERGRRAVAELAARRRGRREVGPGDRPGGPGRRRRRLGGGATGAPHAASGHAERAASRGPAARRGIVTSPARRSSRPAASTPASSRHSCMSSSNCGSPGAGSPGAGLRAAPELRSTRPPSNVGSGMSQPRSRMHWAWSRNDCFSSAVSGLGARPPTRPSAATARRRRPRPRAARA